MERRQRGGGVGSPLVLPRGCGRLTPRPPGRYHQKLRDDGRKRRDGGAGGRAHRLLEDGSPGRHDGPPGGDREGQRQAAAELGVQRDGDDGERRRRRRRRRRRVPAVEPRSALPADRGGSGGDATEGAPDRPPPPARRPRPEAGAPAGGGNGGGHGDGEEGGEKDP